MMAGLRQPSGPARLMTPTGLDLTAVSGGGDATREIGPSGRCTRVSPLQALRGCADRTAAAHGCICTQALQAAVGRPGETAGGTALRSSTVGTTLRRCSMCRVPRSPAPGMAAHGVRRREPPADVAAGPRCPARPRRTGLRPEAGLRSMMPGAFPFICTGAYRLASRPEFMPSRRIPPHPA